MNKILIIICFGVYSCASNKCLESNRSLHSRFIKVFEADKFQLSKASKDDLKVYNSEMMIREKIFSKICKYVNGTKKLLYLENNSPINSSRVGLIYLYDEDRFINFTVDLDLDITVDGGYTNYEELKKVVDLVKKDFENQANRLKKYFEKKDMFDVPYLELLLIDLTDNKGKDNLIGFPFGSVNDDEFKIEFGTE